MPYQMHRPKASNLDELNNVLSQFRRTIRAAGAGSSARRVAALVGCDGAVSTRVQERGNRVPRVRVLRETMQEKYWLPVDRPGVMHVENEPVPRETGDPLSAHQNPFSATMRTAAREVTDPRSISIEWTTGPVVWSATCWACSTVPTRSRSRRSPRLGVTFATGPGSR